MSQTITEPGLDLAIARIAGTSRLLVALDFDGTVAPIARRPELARPTPRAAAAIATLAGLADTTVAYVSGRSLASLTAVAQAPAGALMIGSHGAEHSLPGQPVSAAAASGERVVLDALDAILRLIASTAPGAWVEAKPYGRVLHTREADPVLGEYATRSALNSAGRGLPGVVARSGKNVVEFATRRETKGDAIRLLRHYAGATGVVFSGDDLTDEDAFAALGSADLGVHSGPGETVAGFRLDGPDEIAALLDALAVERSRAVGVR